MPDEPYDDEQNPATEPVPELPDIPADEEEVRVTREPPTKAPDSEDVAPTGTADPVLTIEARLAAIEECRRTARAALARLAEHSAAIAGSADEMRRRV